MQKKFEEFIERLESCIDKNDCKKALEAVVHGFDLPSFAYLSLPYRSRDKPLLISNYSVRWISHYLDQSYERVDPVVERARYGNRLFKWESKPDAPELAPSVKKFFDEATNFGICCGFTIPIHDRRGAVAAMTFAADKPIPAFFRTAERYSLALQLMATFFHMKARNILSGDRCVRGVILTKREFECLQWAALGKSAWDIGKILGVSRRTAAFHLDNARHKLGVRTIAQAVACLASSHSSFR